MFGKFIKRYIWSIIITNPIPHGFSLPHFDKYGYKLAMITNDEERDDGSNYYASIISKKGITDDVILVDDDIDLTVDNLKELIGIIHEPRKYAHLIK